MLNICIGCVYTILVLAEYLCWLYLVFVHSSFAAQNKSSLIWIFCGMCVSHAKEHPLIKGAPIETNQEKPRADKICKLILLFGVNCNAHSITPKRWRLIINNLIFYPHSCRLHASHTPSPIQFAISTLFCFKQEFVGRFSRLFSLYGKCSWIHRKFLNKFSNCTWILPEIPSNTFTTIILIISQIY